jgi:excisionase family DNA binding protein
MTRTQDTVTESAAAPRTAQRIVLTVEEAAEALGIGRTLMYELIGSGAVESVTIGRLRRVPADALGAFVNQLRKSVGEQAGAR